MFSKCLMDMTCLCVYVHTDGRVEDMGDVDVSDY